MASAKDMKNRQKRMTQMTDAKKRAEEHATFFRPTAFNPGKLPVFDWSQKGVYWLDIVPYIAGQGNPFAKVGFGHYERTFWQHPYIGSEGGFGNDYCCLKRTFSKPCPICDYRAALEEDAGADKDKLILIDKLKPKERQLMLVVVRDGKENGGDGKEEKKGVQVYTGPNFNGLGKALDDKISLSSDAEGYGSFYDPDDGKRLRVEVSEESYKGKPWFKPFGIEFKERAPLDDKYLAVAKPGILDGMLVEMTYDELQEIFLQGASGRGAKKDAKDESSNGQSEPDANVDTGGDDDPAGPAVGDTVDFKYRGKDFQGDIVAINEGKGVAKVKCADREDPYIVSLNEMTKAVADAPVAGDDWDDVPEPDKDVMQEGLVVTVPKKPAWGECTVVVIGDDKLRLEDANGGIHDGVPVSQVSQVAYVPPAKETPAPAAADDDDDWGDNTSQAASDEGWGDSADGAAAADDDSWGDAADEAPPPKKSGNPATTTVKVRSTKKK